MVVSSIYMMIDGIFVGRYIGSHALAAVNLAFPVIMILFAVGDMVAVGSSVKIALLLGQGKNKEANGLFSAAFCMILGIFHNGSSEFFNNISGSFMSTVVNAFLLHLGGGTAVAAYGIVMYLDSLLLMALYGILDSLQPPVSYNIGAGNHQKAREFFRLSCKVTAAISLACLLAMVCFPRELASLFLQENSAEVLEMTVTALRLYAPAYLFLWLNMVISSFLTAMDRAKDSLTIMLFRALIFPSLSLAIFPQILDVTGIFITPAISGALTVIISTTIWRRLGKQQPQEA